MDIEQVRERERERERERKRDTENEIKRKEKGEKERGSERDREAAKQKERERKQAVGGALVCSTSLPGGNQVDGLPPALVQIIVRVTVAASRLLVFYVAI